jgi:hypothetical protein
MLAVCLAAGGAHMLTRIGWGPLALRGPAGRTEPPVVRSAWLPVRPVRRGVVMPGLVKMCVLSAGGDEQLLSDGLVVESLADEPGDLWFGGGEAGTAGRGAFASAASACCVGGRVFEGECLALIPWLSEAVVSEDDPGHAGGLAAGSQARGQVLQPGPGAPAATRSRAASLKRLRAAASRPGNSAPAAAPMRSSEPCQARVAVRAGGPASASSPRRRAMIAKVAQLIQLSCAAAAGWPSSAPCAPQA